MNKLTQLKKQLYTDTSGRWVSAKDVDLLLDGLVVDIVENMFIHATCFDGDVGRGIKTAARLITEQYGKETP